LQSHIFSIWNCQTFPQPTTFSATFLLFCIVLGRLATISQLQKYCVHF
jgi:hypothetical protein